MIKEKLESIGLRKRAGFDTLYTIFLGGNTFLHCLDQSDSEFRVHVWYGYEMDFEKCVSVWHSPRSIEELDQLIKLLS